MSKAAKKRRFLKWRTYRRNCEKVTGERMSLTKAMMKVWTRSMYRVCDGAFLALPPWFPMRHPDDVE